MIDDVPPALARILEGELAPGERLVWHAVPALSGLIEFRIVSFLCGILLIVIIGGDIWIHHLTRSLEVGKLISLRPFDIVLLFLGCYSALLPLAVLRLSRRTLYAITDRRAILIRAPFYRRIQSFTGEQLVRIYRRENRHGRGDVIFERNIGFTGLPNAKAVEELLRQTYQATRSS